MSDPSRFSGTIVRANIAGKEIGFFVTNQNDSIMKYHYNGAFYEQEELQIVEKYFHGGVFLDVGANVGNHAIYVSKFLNPSRVIVFEPNPAVVPLLEFNLRLNSCTDVDTRFLGIALSNIESRVRAVSPDPENIGGTMFFQDRDGTILARVGDEVLENEQVDFIKLDVEGMELEVLTGLNGTISRCRPRMFVEVWGERFPEFASWCRSHSYRIAEEYQRYEGIRNYLVLLQENAVGMKPAVEGTVLSKLGNLPKQCIYERRMPVSDFPSTSISASRVFIYSSWRTCSTWFWEKFRSVPGTVCLCEPFNEDLRAMTRSTALTLDYRSWDSGHPPGDPYYLGFLPLIRRSGGVRLFQREMPFEWFIPLGGLRGDLRTGEKRYLELLIRHAERLGKVPVLADPRFLGRLHAIKSNFGGLNFFLHRNLWHQWLSYIYLKETGLGYFYGTVLKIVDRSDDLFLSYLRDYYITRANLSNSLNGLSQQPGQDEPINEYLLRALSDRDVFEVFVAIHLYLYMSAQSAADMTVDVTKLARSDDYRVEVEEGIAQRTGIPISLSDVRDNQRPVPFSGEAVDWKEIQRHVQKAIQIVGEFLGWSEVGRAAQAIIDDTIIESKVRKGKSTSAGHHYFTRMASFLSAADQPSERQRLARDLDARLPKFLDNSTALATVQCFYEVLSETAEHRSLRAATASMRAAGHPVRMWTYSPEKLEFLRPLGVELADAADIVPRGLYERMVARAEVRYFSDLFRYALLYEQGGLWMDTDVVLLRPFPWRGDYFLNMQWRGGHVGHYICGNVLYAKPYSRHMRHLYETSLDRFSQLTGEREFGDIGPKLLSDYVMSDAGAELREWVFSPVLFNPIDWTELDTFGRPIAELADYLHDDRVFGIHLWNAMTDTQARDGGDSLISLLSDPTAHLPRLVDLANRFQTDKNRHIGNRHCYARIYDRLLRSRRLAMRRIMEIGLSRWNRTETPSVSLWQSYFPFCEVIGVDRGDFSALNTERFSSFLCDQSQRDEVRMVAEALEPASMDVIIDDGSHASADQQMCFAELFPLLAPGGWYFIEDLDWQPPGEDLTRIALTKELFRELQERGEGPSLDPFGVAGFLEDIEQILLFDSHYELVRAGLRGGLLAIRKRGGSGLV